MCWGLLAGGMSKSEIIADYPELKRGKTSKRLRGVCCGDETYPSRALRNGVIIDLPNHPAIGLNNAFPPLVADIDIAVFRHSVFLRAQGVDVGGWDAKKSWKQI